MKLLITALIATILFSTVSASTEVEETAAPFALEQRIEYAYVSDIIRFWFDAIILFFTGFFLWFASFFANCQECYVSYVTGFMNAKLLRLSYKYIV